MSESNEHSDSNNSQRYELQELFPGEAPENLHSLQVLGQVFLIALLVMASVFVFAQLSK